MDNLNEKKTAEEILDKISHTYHPEFNARYVRQEAAITSMHRFATQETAALREENERLKEALKELLSVVGKSIQMHGHAFAFSDAEFEQLQIESMPIIENAKKLTTK